MAKPVTLRLSFRDQPRSSAPLNVRWIREGVRAYLAGTVLSFLVCLSLNAALVAGLFEYTALNVAGGALIAAGSDFLAALLFFSRARLKFRRVHLPKTRGYDDEVAGERERD